MANKGKFIDRNPNLRSAGTVVEPNCNVGDSLKIYSNEEAAAIIMGRKCNQQIQSKREKSYIKVTPFLPDEDVKELLSPELKKTRFIAFREKFSEDMFFKKAELGQVFPLDSKPPQYTNTSFTYGRPLPKAIRLYDLVLPKRKVEEINREYLAWHDKYIKSHSHYFPSERIKRPYNEAFKPHSTFGKKTNADTSGRQMRLCLTTNDRLVLVTRPHKEFKDRTSGRLGQIINKNQKLEDDFVGALCKPDECDVRALLENIHPCVNKNKLALSLSHINQIRRNLFNRSDFHMFDLKFALQQYDPTNSGYLKFSDILSALRNLVIQVDKEKLRQAISYYKYVENEGQTNERISLDLFWKMLHIQYPLPRIGNLAELPKNNYNKDTTYSFFCKDHFEPLKPERPNIHIPTDADRTRAGDVIAPDIPMHYALAPSDFEKLRSKDEIKRIFKGILTDNFDEVWEKARTKINGDENCKISVELLREVLTS